ncbi:hypothetical protein [Caloramator sp. Dgby_cultured_2]|uniref:hypothetical protein n=1 Tax=Caloramator sp. Dgby_cultured_2 TaxID=3029174 RepID=UPI00237E9E13|nr:hypothetical protein [Caloramator sp. Dgby_cultured_2]WDU83937.1 hypothetical protein PWK10_05550 [Caloramator sp. Dgby_cultured_2]
MKKDRRRVPCKKEDIVKVVPKIIEGKRNLNIYVTEDAMEVYIDISYEPYIEYEIEDMEPQHELFITGKIKHKSIKKFTREEIEKSLREKILFMELKRRNRKGNRWGQIPCC